MRCEDLTIPSETYTLPARLFLPEDAPAAAYVIHGATGVPWDYYTPFAEWVADQGFACLTYAYRSDGQDVASIKSSTVTMSDWGIAGQNAALNTLTTRFPDLPIRVIGHSLGGFMTMFHDQTARVERLSAICSGPAYWRRAPRHALLPTWLFWYVLGPVSMATLGYVSKRFLGATDHLPSSAFRQWKRWCTNPDLHMRDWGKLLPQPDAEAFAGRLNLVALADDHMIPPPVVADLARFYPAAQASFKTLDPADIGPKLIGHLAVFRPRAKQFWPELL